MKIDKKRRRHLEMNIQKVLMITRLALLAVLFTVGSMSFAGEKVDNKTTLKDVDQEVKEAVEAIKNYSSNQRDEAIKQVSDAIEKLDARIDDLEIRVEKKWGRMNQSARDKARAALKSVRKKRNELAEWYGGMQHSSSNAWQHVKKGFLDSYETLSKAYDQAVKEF
jgi:hypothetical protein